MISPENQQDLLHRVTQAIVSRRPVEEVETLLQDCTDLNRSLRNGVKALHYAATGNSIPYMSLLLDHGAAINVGDDHGYTALHLACRECYYEAAEFLIAKGACINVCEEDQSKLEGAPGGSGEPAVSLSCQMHAYLTVHPLNLAIENNHHRIVKLLLERGANPNNKYIMGSELNLVPLENGLESLRLLLQFGADANSFSRSGMTILMRACKLQKVEAVSLLLEHGSDVNLQCPPRFDQRTALHFAALSGNVEISRLLLEAGAETRILPGLKYSVLELAIANDKLDVLRLLLEFRADPNEISEEGTSPMQAACTAPSLKYRRELVEALLEHGANPDYFGDCSICTGPVLTPLVEYLMIIGESGGDYDFRIVKTLVEFGARVNLTTAMKFSRVVDPCGILDQVKKLRVHADIFGLLVEAACVFDFDSIRRNSSLSNGQKDWLLHAASEPRRLRHLARLVVRANLHRPKVKAVQRLAALPSFLKDYLLFRVS